MLCVRRVNGVRSNAKCVSGSWLPVPAARVVGTWGASNSATLALNVTRAADCIATLITTFTQ